MAITTVCGSHNPHLSQDCIAIRSSHLACLPLPSSVRRPPGHDWLAFTNKPPLFLGIRWQSSSTCRFPSGIRERKSHTKLVARKSMTFKAEHVKPSVAVSRLTQPLSAAAKGRGGPRLARSHGAHVHELLRAPQSQACAGLVSKNCQLFNFQHIAGMPF